MNNNKKLIINSLIGGNGDIWMRLISFYAVAGILDDYQIHLLIPPFLRKLAKHTFGDRLVFTEENTPHPNELIYSHLGMLSLIKGMFKGKRYISPYQRSVIHDKKKKKIKDFINLALFTVADFFSVVHVPSWKWLEVYQGYVEVISIKKLRHITYEQYLIQLRHDYDIIRSKLSVQLPISAELTFPDDLKHNIVVFPTGTSRQFIPVWWAKKYLPDAYFAFFHKDKDADQFLSEGLKVIPFYEEPGDIIALAKASKWAISTDSFPSHLLQSATNECTITITEILRTKIISPTFKGKVVNSRVDCHPCVHMARKINPLCAAGFSECQNWKNNLYSVDLMNSVIF